MYEDDKTLSIEKVKPLFKDYKDKINILFFCKETREDILKNYDEQINYLFDANKINLVKFSPTSDTPAQIIEVFNDINKSIFNNSLDVVLITKDMPYEARKCLYKQNLKIIRL